MGNNYNYGPREDEIKKIKCGFRKELNLVIEKSKENIYVSGDFN